jgi:D-3-phosphoglycerate dehydrogenase
MNILCIGDAMISSKYFAEAARQLHIKVSNIEVNDWEKDWDKLQKRRLAIEKRGPSAEKVVSQISNANKGTEILLALFCPISRETMDALPQLRLIGVARGGLENVDIGYATRKGILIHHIKGRNAQAVSDFTVGLIIAEARNITRSYYAIKNGVWRKNYTNSDMIPELQEKTIGLIGFGYVGQLVAKKLSGFEVKILAYDPYISDDITHKYNARKVNLQYLLQNSDFISLHARLEKENENMLGERELALIKKTAYLINTARAGLIKEDALFDLLKNRRIAGAALDVFWEEPISKDSPWLMLDNVTLTSHIAGTTREALTKSPFLLVEDINKLLDSKSPQFVVNPEVLEDKEFQAWLERTRSAGC